MASRGCRDVPAPPAGPAAAAEAGLPTRRPSTVGKARLKAHDHGRRWYSEFLDHIGREHIFASVLTPSEYGASADLACRWDTYQISEFAEIVGFYGLNYCYPFQVTALGLGPIWMSANEDAKHKAAAQLQAGEVFAFGLSEQSHGADVYQTDMV